MGRKANAERLERGYLKVTTENLASWTLLSCEKPSHRINRDTIGFGCVQNILENPAVMHGGVGDLVLPDD